MFLPKNPSAGANINGRNEKVPELCVWRCALPVSGGKQIR